MIANANWFSDLFSTFTDATVYFYMGAVGSILFLIRMGLLVFSGVDSDVEFDADIDVDVDGGIHAHGGDFTLFSMLSIVSFLMGAGWLGLACRVEWDMRPLAAAACASGFGFGLMLLSSLGMYQLRKLNEEGRYDVRNSIGQIGRVYLTIPAKGEGRGRVRVSVDGRQKVLAAVSTGEAIESFTAVKIVDVQEGETLIVEKE